MPLPKRPLGKTRPSFFVRESRQMRTVRAKVPNSSIDFEKNIAQPDHRPILR